MPISKDACASNELLTRLIVSDITPREELQLQAHLDACPRCQSKLERLAGDDQLWTELPANLSGRDSLDTSTTHTSTGNLHTETGPAIEHLVSLLGPSDFPENLGRVGGYEVTGVIGQGGTGIVFKAFETSLNRFVAIKVMSPSLSSNAAARKRFEQEGRAIAAVAHEHVVAIYAVDEHRGLPYIVMQYVAGASLQHRIDNQGQLEPREIIRIAMQIANGISAAHAQGIVHRDIKPANILLEHGLDRAVVGDFGLARVVDSASHTMSGVITGTPSYMAPEQVKAEPIDSRSDLFSLGSVMFAMCTGHPPFRAETVFGVLRRICDDEARSVHEINAAIPEWLSAFISKLLTNAREERFTSAEQVAKILANELAHLQNPTGTRKPAREWLSHPPWFAPHLTPKKRIFKTLAIATTLIAAILFVASIGDNKDSEKPSDLSGFDALAEIDQVIVLRKPGTPQDKPTDQPVAFAIRKDHAPPPPPHDASLSSVSPTKAIGIPGQFVTIKRDYPGKTVDGYTLYLPRSYSKASGPYPVLVYLGNRHTVGENIHHVNAGYIPNLIQQRLAHIQATEDFEQARLDRLRVSTDFSEETLDRKTISVDPDPLRAKKEQLDQYLLDTFIIVAPHISKGQYYHQSTAILKVVTEILKAHHSDPERVYLTGAGQGGSGVWGLAANLHGVFAAAAPIAGNVQGVAHPMPLTEIPLWITHNIGDPTYDYNQTAKAIQKLEEISQTPFYRVEKIDPTRSEYMNQSRILITPKKDHPDSWASVYKDPSLYKWLLKHKLSDYKPDWVDYRRETRTLISPK